MTKHGLRRAQQIASQRRFTYEREESRCVVCLTQRDPRSFPICNHCLGTGDA